MRNFAIAIVLAMGATTFALWPANAAAPIMADGKCWTGDPKTNGTYKWSACPKEHVKKVHVAKAKGKGHKTARAEHKPEHKKA